MFDTDHLNVQFLMTKTEAGQQLKKEEELALRGETAVVVSTSAEQGEDGIE